MLIFRLDRVRFAITRPEVMEWAKTPKNAVLFSFVTPWESPCPVLETWLHGTRINFKSKSLEALLLSGLKACSIVEVANFTENKSVRLGNSGTILFQTRELPEYFTWTLVAGYSTVPYLNSPLSISDLMRDDCFSLFARSIGQQKRKVVSNEASRFETQAEVNRFVALAYIQRLVSEGGIQIGALTVKFSKDNHYPNYILQSRDMPDMMGNLLFDVSLFAHQSECLPT